jgi:hypothetical protein
VSEDDEENERRRAAQADDDDELTREPDTGTAGYPTVLATCGSGGTTPAAGKFFTMTAATVYGNPTAGGTASVVAGRTFFAVAVGNTPAAGKQYLCTYVRNRWVFQA